MPAHNRTQILVRLIIILFIGASFILFKVIVCVVTLTPIARSAALTRLPVSDFDELENNKRKLKKPSSSLYEIEEGYLLILD
jgi:hypothetical protein